MTDPKPERESTLMAMLIGGLVMILVGAVVVVMFV